MSILLPFMCHCVYLSLICKYDQNNTCYRQNSQNQSQSLNPEPNPRPQPRAQPQTPDHVYNMPRKILITQINHFMVVFRSLMKTTLDKQLRANAPINVKHAGGGGEEAPHIWEFWSRFHVPRSPRNQKLKILAARGPLYTLGLSIYIQCERAAKKTCKLLTDGRTTDDGGRTDESPCQ